MQSAARYGAWIAGLLLALIATPALAAIAIELSPEQLARRSAVVVEAHVSSASSGFDPERGTLATYVTLEVEVVHRGARDLERIILREAGGRHRGRQLVVDAAPRYTAGETVLVFAEAASDGALRTSGMFYGKFRIEERAGRRVAVRRIRRYGKSIEQAEAVEDQPFSIGDLVAVALSRVEGAGGRRWLPEPPEYRRLLHEPAPADGPESAAFDALGTPSRLGSVPAMAGEEGAFVPFAGDAPARWEESDSGAPVRVHIERARNPLDNGAAAAWRMVEAMRAWSDVPEARVRLAPGRIDAHYTAIFAEGPERSFSGHNIVLFGDPYDSIPDPVDCSGVLAIGGYWRDVEPSGVVNGRLFYPIRQLYVIFNNDFECFLGDGTNLAEIAAHELGHGLGFGHSQEPDALMRATAYGSGRGPRLGDDDVDAAHCHYPHRIELLRPAADEVWNPGESRAIEWESSAESGPDPGRVDIELSADGGQSWTPVAVETPNDGYLPWTVSSSPSAEAWMRVVRRPRGAGLPSGYPEVCSGDPAGRLFRIEPPEPLPVVPVAPQPSRGSGPAARHLAR